MATIVLRPGETFEHYHCAPSQTIHVSGDVEFRIEGISRVMRSGESIWVAENAKHSVRNIGQGRAEITCVGSGPGRNHVG